MLQHLYIKNYALFKESHIDFLQGLNILTGETGAGKSLLIGALGLIMGKRADSSFVFLYDEKCIVEGTFGRLPSIIQKQLDAFEEFDLEANGEITIRREIRPNGKSRAFINDTPVSLQLLREVSSLLLDMHGQHDNQVLLSADKQLDLLDEYADCSDELQQYQAQLKIVDSLSQQIAELEEKERTAKGQWEYLKFQVDELDKAGLQANEEDELEQELNLLQHSEEIREALGGAIELLYQVDNSIYNQLSEVIVPLRKVSTVNQNLGESVQGLDEMLEQIKESTFSFQEMLELVETDPQRLAFIEERLAMYHSLKLKYQVQSGQELVDLYEGIATQLTEFDSLEENIQRLRKEFEQAVTLLGKWGQQLESRRLKAQPLLQQTVDMLLAQVGFQKARFMIDIKRNFHENGSLELDGARIKPLSHGINKVYFQIQTNPGVPAGSLSQIASGGEISRVMLAIKAALAEKSSFPVMIFDEIDTGISGEIAKKVGVVMQQLANKFQILSITHLPQIAAKGKAHFFIRKKVEGEKTFSSVSQLDHDARIKVVAQMLSGDEPTASAIKNAEELITINE
ncbi:MAG: DNA repair protein RecN [Bacteroidota bacterium]